MKSRIFGKKITLAVLVGILTLSLAACSGKNNADSNAANANMKEDTKTEASAEGAINAITREQGSGTRSAFTEITGVMEKDADGNEVDNTSEELSVQNSTNAVLTTVSNDENAIGYISLGSLNDTVKALKVEGVEADHDKVKSGDYKIARPFNLVYKADLDPAAQDLIDFIMSDEGQEIVSNEGYVGDPQGKKYEGSGSNAHLTIAGSTSVTPLMEKLIEGYKKYNPDFQGDIQATGSSAGVKAAQDGSAQIGMASREIKPEETGVEKLVIAMDGIAVIVNNDSPVEDLTIEQIKDIFTGKITDWSEIK